MWFDNFKALTVRGPSAVFGIRSASAPSGSSRYLARRWVSRPRYLCGSPASDASSAPSIRLRESIGRDVAVAAGDFDQAHIIRDFRQFAGVTPSAYCAVERQQITY